MSSGSGQAAPPQAGWYPDPSKEGQERLWDGTEWLEWIRPFEEGRTEAKPAGWYPYSGRRGEERLWSGDMWTGRARPAAGHESPQPSAQATEGPSGAGMTYFDSRPPQRVVRLGYAVVALLVLTACAYVAFIITTQKYIGYESDLISGKNPGLPAIQTAFDNQGTARGIALLSWFMTSIVFLVWFYRAYRNLVRGGIHDLRYGLGWAVGGWFIPIFNWFRPKAIANDVWRGSLALSEGRVGEWRQLKVDSIVHWWWGCWIAGTIIGVGSNQIVSEANSSALSMSSLKTERNGLYAEELSIVLLIIAAVLAVQIVRRISEMQDGAFAPSAEAASELSYVIESSHPPANSSGDLAAQVGSPPDPVVVPPEAPVAPARSIRPDPPTERAEEGSDDMADDSGTKLCPECAETVKAAAHKCRFCGYRFAEE